MPIGTATFLCFGKSFAENGVVIVRLLNKEISRVPERWREFESSDDKDLPWIWQHSPARVCCCLCLATSKLGTAAHCSFCIRTRWCNIGPNRSDQILLRVLRSAAMGIKTVASNTMAARVSHTLVRLSLTNHTLSVPSPSGHGTSSSGRKLSSIVSTLNLFA